MNSFFFDIARAAEAVPIAPNPADAAATPAGDASAVLSNAANNVLPIILLIAGILAVFYTVWAGIQYITSAGDAGKAKVARAGIINGIIGVVVIIAAYAIIRLAVGLGHFANNAVGDAKDPSSVSRSNA